MEPPRQEQAQHPVSQVSNDILSLPLSVFKPTHQTSNTYSEKTRQPIEYIPLLFSCTYQGPNEFYTHTPLYMIRNDDNREHIMIGLECARDIGRLRPMFDLDLLFNLQGVKTVTITTTSRECVLLFRLNNKLYIFDRCPSFDACVLTFLKWVEQYTVIKFYVNKTEASVYNEPFGVIVKWQTVDLTTGKVL